MGRPQTVLSIEHRTERVPLTAAEFSKDKEFFGIQDNRRRLHEDQVKKLYKLLEAGMVPEAPIVVNLRQDGTRVLIDGNHRAEAIRRFLMANPTCKVTVEMHTYDGLDDEGERKTYTSYNSGIRQSTNDFVMQYKNDILLWKLMQEWNGSPVNVTVYPSANSVTFYGLVSAYLSCLTPVFGGGYAKPPGEFVEDAKELGHTDAKTLKAFLNDYIDAFGPRKNNSWFRGTPLTAIMRIWLDNKGELSQNVIINRFKTKLANDKEAIEIGTSSGITATKYARDRYLKKLNQNYQNRHFVKGDAEQDE